MTLRSQKDYNYKIYYKRGSSLHRHQPGRGLPRLCLLATNDTLDSYCILQVHLK
jgi:hypothetical protein